MDLRTLHVSIESLALGYTMLQFFTILSFKAAFLCWNQFCLLLLWFHFLLYSVYEWLNLDHFLKLSDVLRELRKQLIFSIVNLNLFKVGLILILRHLKFFKVLHDKVFVCLFKLFNLDRVVTKLIEFGINFFVELISLCS